MKRSTIMAWGGYGRNSPDYVEGTRALTPVAPPVKTVEVAAPAKTVVAASSTHAHHCGDCGADVAASARFCSNCGFNLVAARTERARHACS
ncbi:MAG: zinc ribbon domain-containing protein, partial [Cyanobacteria bacterium]|nr:zinc ribbon domain-containing protein [Cyanobacteriota bacterium]